MGLPQTNSDSGPVETREIMVTGVTESERKMNLQNVCVQGQAEGWKLEQYNDRGPEQSVAVFSRPLDLPNSPSSQNDNAVAKVKAGAKNLAVNIVFILGGLVFGTLVGVMLGKSFGGYLVLGFILAVYFVHKYRKEKGGSPLTAGILAFGYTGAIYGGMMAMGPDTKNPVDTHNTKSAKATTKPKPVLTSPKKSAPTYKYDNLFYSKHTPPNGRSTRIKGFYTLQKDANQLKNHCKKQGNGWNVCFYYSFDRGASIVHYSNLKPMDAISAAVKDGKFFRRVDKYPNGDIETSVPK